MKKHLIAPFFLFIMSAVLAQVAVGTALAAASPTQAASSTATSKMPTKDEVDAAMKRTLGSNPALTWTIYDIRPSLIPGLADVLVGINSGANTGQPQHIFYSAETQTAIHGDMIPFGPNPFVSTRAALKAADGPAQGSQTPAIMLVEFSDLECPHCKAAQPIVEKLVADFPQIRYVFQQFPLPASMHPWALKASEYADCVGRLNPESFWKYIDTIFENQGSVAAATADDKLKEFATTVGLDAQKISTCAALPLTEARVKKSVDLGQSLDVNQTPTLFVNGRRLLGIADIPYQQLKELVQFEIDHAGK